MSEERPLSEEEKIIAKKIEADKTLQERVGTGKIDEKVVEKAQKVIDNNKVDFKPIAEPLLKELNEAIEYARDNIDDADKVMEGFATPIMNLKANAGTFKFELISGLTGTVLNFLENIKQPDKKVVMIVDLLQKTILLILAYKMSGDGGNEGRALMAAFSEVTQKYHQKLVKKGMA